MKVAVFAGTSVDTKMGQAVLEKMGIETLAYPLASNPQEQTKLQYYSKDKLEEIFINLALEGKKLGMEKIFIYCNSLSTVIDYKKISQILGLDVITPLESYTNLDRKIRNLAILAANGVSAFNIDKMIKDYREDINTITYGNLSVVNSIEEDKTPQEIIENLNLKGLIKYLEEIKDPRYKIDSILLACTHFSYLTQALKEITDINIIDPTEDMIKRLLK